MTAAPLFHIRFKGAGYYLFIELGQPDTIRGPNTAVHRTLKNFMALTVQEHVLWQLALTPAPSKNIVRISIVAPLWINQPRYKELR